MLKLDRFCQSLAVLPDLVPDFSGRYGNDVGPNALEDAPLPRLAALLLSNCELLSSLPPLWAQLAAYSGSSSMVAWVSPPSPLSSIGPA